MALWDEPERKPAAAITVGDSLATMSVAELEVRIAALRAEITRCEAEIGAKKGTLHAAEAFFGKR